MRYDAATRPADSQCTRHLNSRCCYRWRHQSGQISLGGWGTDVNVKMDGEITPLHCAVDRGHKEIIELLIANGANVNAKMERGETPLDWAMGGDET